MVTPPERWRRTIRKPVFTITLRFWRHRRQFADVVISVDGEALKLETKPKMPGLDSRVPQAGPAQRLGFHAKDKLLRLEGPAKGSAAESLSAAQAARWRGRA